jgi:hypothetical protein
MLPCALAAGSACARRARAVPVCTLLRVSTFAVMPRGARAAAAAAPPPAAAPFGASRAATFSAQCSPRQRACVSALAPASPALGGGAGAVRGISTKRRRNAAMNRHKLQKLRKRMRKLMAKNVSSK